MNETILISRLNELPRLKQVLQELLEMVNQDDVDFGKLADKMVQDQVLTARLLRMANSAHFGGAKNISSINDAIIRVGSGPIRTLVIASVLSGAFPKLTTLNLKDYWGNTFEISTVASKIASKVGLNPNEVFTTSVLHNIGELMIHSLLPNEALEIEKRIKAGENRFDLQKEILGTSSPVIGSRLAKAWKFPDNMVDAILNFNTPSNAKISPILASTIHFASDINAAWDHLIEEENKIDFIAVHPISNKLNIETAFFEIIDSVRGNGHELAEQLG